MLRGRSGQSTLEYALVIAVVIAALIVINTYLQKGVQGKLKESSDQIGTQFDPASFSNAWHVKSAGNTVTNEARVGGATTSTVSAGELITKDDKQDWGAAPGQKY